MNPIIFQSKPGLARRWPLAAAGITGVVVVAWILSHANHSIASQPAQKSPPSNPVYELAAADISTLQAQPLQLNLPVSGSLTPSVQVTVKSKIAGDVREANVQEGMTVKSGQVIARLDAADLRARLAAQQATLEEAQARLALAQKNDRSNQVLLQQKYISQNAYDVVQNNVDLAQAGVRSATSSLDIAKIALADTQVRSPISGIVSKRHVQPGEKVSPDMPLLTIVNLQQLTFEAQVPAGDIPRVKLNQAVNFHVDGFQNRKFSGKVARINPATEAGSRMIAVYISVDNPDGALKGGMFAKGEITTDQSRSNPVLPLAALRKEQGRDVVYVIENAKVVARPVTLGLRNDDEGLAEVLGGVNAGSKIIVAQLSDVKPGSAVKLPSDAGQPAAAAAAQPAPLNKKS